MDIEHVKIDNTHTQKDWKEMYQNVSRAYAFNNCVLHLLFIYFN